MVKYIAKTFKNGTGVVVHTYEIDDSKPVCRVEGMEYKFNSRIIRSEYFQEKSNGR